MSDKTQNIKTKLEGMILTIYLEGIIDKNSSPDLEKQIFTAINSNPKTLPKFDVEGLKDISNEGIHLFKKIQSIIPIKLKIQNVSNEIYDILYNTGLTEIYNVKKVLRTINIEELEKIGDGVMSKVYKLDEGKVIKVFESNINFDFMIERENEFAKVAFISGVPTPISYDIVKVGNNFGNIYEYLDAKDLVVIMENDKDHLVDYIKLFANELKKVHKIKINQEKSESIKNKSLELLPLLEGEGKILNKEEMEKIKKIFEIIPDSNTFIHGDCHPGNVMYKNGKLFFIDLGTSGYGHPIFDIGSMFMLYNIVAADPERRKKRQAINFLMMKK